MFICVRTDGKATIDLTLASQIVCHVLNRGIALEELACNQRDASTISCG
jgi:hypothetical protein